jgi:aldehyde:ferredoxin oxidoreductase
MIANREGLGDLLAEGSTRAAKKLGNDTMRYSMAVKGNEMTAFEARSQTNLALGFATASVGPRYEICEHDWDFDTQVGWSHTLDYCRTIGILDRIPMEHLGKDKVRNFKALNTLWSAADGLGICLFATAPTRVYSLEDMARVVHIVTGWETSAYEVMRIGELRNHIFRVYNYREGLTAADDKLPDRFFEEPIDFGTHKGVKLDRNKFKEAIELYYDMMGWDKTGKPKESTLFDFGLDWLCQKEPTQ